MEKKREKRFKQWNKARIQSLSQGSALFDPPQFQAYTYDLSLGGAKIYSPEPLPVGAALQIRLELLRSGESVSVGAEVKWVKRNPAEKIFEIGVMFDHSAPQTTMALMKNLFDEGAGISTTVTRDSGSEEPQK
jgi:hypothetical protein